MKQVVSFDDSILNNTENHFCIQVVYRKYITVDLSVPQHRIVDTLQSHLDNKPKRIDLYWSNAPVYQVIIDDLKSKDLTDFDRLRQLIKRCPWLYAYSFHERKNDN